MDTALIGSDGFLPKRGPIYTCLLLSQSYQKNTPDYNVGVFNLELSINMDTPKLGKVY